MADPATIIGTTGAVANINLLGKTICALYEAHQQWKDTDFTLLNLAARLTALRAALTKIQEWTETDTTSHHLLVMDLEVSISCCRMLIGKINAQVSELHSKEDGSLDAASRIRVVFRPFKLDDLQKMIERQTSVLTLLLTACNCKSVSEQMALLQRTSTRKALGRIEKDSASLLAHHDTNSFLCRNLDRLSNLSIIFSFYKDLFISHVYERVLRGSLKDTLRWRKGEILSSEKRSRMIDRRLKKDSKMLKREVKVLIFDSGDRGKDKIIEQLNLIYKSPADEFSPHRPRVLRNLVDCAKSLAMAMGQLDIEPEQEINRENRDFLMNFDLCSSSHEEATLGERFAIALSTLWKDPCIPKLMKRSGEFYMMDSAPYFFDEVARIAADDYIPVRDDILRLESRNNGIREIRYRMGRFHVCLLDIEGQRSQSKRWLHQFENVNAIILVISLAKYDQSPSGEPTENELMTSIIVFEAIVNYHWYRKTSIILLLTDVALFMTKLTRSPLETYFPDYSGGSNFDRAADHILQKFVQANRANLTLYAHLLDMDDISKMNFLHIAVKDIVEQKGG